jgi:large subunit ribosomal protein L3
VTQIKTKEKDNENAVQIGFGSVKKFRLNKAEQGHLKDIKAGNDETATVRFLRDQKSEGNSLNRGDVFTVKIFNPGEKVSVVGTSKGRGFQGVVKRHGFHGQYQTHGIKDQTRMPGSLGAGGVQRVFKGMRMGGHMGDAKVTVHNLEVVEVHPENNEILLKGAVPGARGSLLVISSKEGKIEVEKN